MSTNSKPAAIDPGSAMRLATAPPDQLVIVRDNGEIYVSDPASVDEAIQADPEAYFRDLVGALVTLAKHLAAGNPFPGRLTTKGELLAGPISVTAPAESSALATTTRNGN
jgi:hypothetical protein